MDVVSRRVCTSTNDFCILSVPLLTAELNNGIKKEVSSKDVARFWVNDDMKVRSFSPTLVSGVVQSLTLNQKGESRGSPSKTRSPCSMTDTLVVSRSFHTHSSEH